MSIRKKKGFTLIELIAVLVILAILALIVTPLVMNIIRKAKISADKRSVDAYGRSVELAIATHLLDTGAFPTDLNSLTVEYTGKEVVCNVMQMKENGGIYLSECTVGRKEVKDSSTEDGWYHYGTRDLTNEEYVDMYGLALKNASVAYYEENGTPVEDYTTLNIDYKGKPVSCDVTVNYDGTIYMTKCKVNNVDVTSETEEDGYYHYGSIVEPPTAVDDLLAKVNPVTVTNYTDGNTSEMYTFEHPATEQTGALTDYRYIGSTPNNYVTFNNELWRIIGVFTVDDGNGNAEQRVKIVRNEKIPSDMIWNSIEPYENEWPVATLNTYLNGDYYNGLDDISKNMIVNTMYYLGENSNSSCSADDYYNSERNLFISWARTNNSYQNFQSWTSWTGKIALMYPSDYVYTYAFGVDEMCYNDASRCRPNDGVPTKGWIYNSNSNSNQWLLTPTSAYGYAGEHHIPNDGIVSSFYTNSPSGVRPSLYLSSQVKITSGDGSEQHPYQLSL